MRPSLTAGARVPAPQARTARRRAHASLDATQRLGANTLASLTVNTDFAETEVDTRRTNLTRFPLFFPEKRTFFLQGADIFDFGLGTGDDVRPFFSRRIGLLNGNEVPIRVGAKVNGRAGGTQLRRARAPHRAHERPGPRHPADRQHAGRAAAASRTCSRESTVGIIGTAGDPLGRRGSWTRRAATPRTRRRASAATRTSSSGAWALATDREGLTGERRARGARRSTTPTICGTSPRACKRIGDGFDPSLGFVPRRGVQIATLDVNYQPRPTPSHRGTARPADVPRVPAAATSTDLDGRWESYRVFTAPVNWRLESGDRFELNVVPAGERLAAPFAIADGVTIPAGTYHWNRYRVEAGTAPKRRLSGQATWWFGDFYTGTLDELSLTAAWKPSSLFIVELNGTRNVGRLREGDFTQDLIGTRLRVNVSPDLQVNSYVQYDNASDALRREHAAPLDLLPTRRPVRGLQPQHPPRHRRRDGTAARRRRRHRSDATAGPTLGVRLEPAAREAAVRVPVLTPPGPARGPGDA